MKNTREITLNAMFISIILIMSLIPQFGIIQLGVISFQIIHIPVIIAGLVLGTKSGILNGFVFGMITIYVALTRGSSLLDPYFVNPVVSVLPRVIFGMSIGLLAGLLKPMMKHDAVHFGVVSFVSTLIHSIAVFIALYSVFFISGPAIVDGVNSASTLFVFLVGIFTSNAIIEAIAATVIVPPIAIALKKLKGNR